MKKIWLIILGTLVLATALVWVVLFTYQDDQLYLIACDVGQGDAILASWKTYQILVDGGPDSSVLTCLGKHMPFWDRTIEVVVNTHPQLDHYGGLVEVVRRYNVNTFVTTGMDSGNKGWEVLEKEVGSRGIKTIKAKAGTAVSIGLMHLEIVYPVQVPAEGESVDRGKFANDTNVLGKVASKEDPNIYSIVANLSFGEFDALLTGDIIPEITDEILGTGKIGDIDYLKVPHHGSKNGLTTEFLQAAKPEVAVISVGKKNRYGHPSPEIINMLNDHSVKTLRTDEVGDIVVTTDGKTWHLQN